VKTRTFFYFLAVVLVGVVGIPAFGQSQFVKALGGSNSDYGRSVVEISDGGLVVAGYTNSYGAGGWDLLLTKFDCFGNHLWTRTLGATNDDVALSVIEVSDGGVVVTGYTYSYGAGYSDFLLTKFDGSGNWLWTRTVGGANYDVGYSVVEVSDGGLVVAGHTQSFGAGIYDLLLTKFDVSGNYLWTRTLGGWHDDIGYSVVEVSDTGLVVAGFTNSYGAGAYDILLTKFDGSGNHLWTRTLGGDTTDCGISVVEVSDTGFVVTGYIYSYGAGAYDLLLAKFDGSGNTCLGEFVTPTVQSVSPTINIASPWVNTPSPTITSPSPTITSPAPTTRVVCDDRAPTILSIADVGNDQGRQVRVKWRRCYFDSLGAPLTITEYSLWRRVDQYLTSGLEDESLPTQKCNPYDRLAYPPGNWDFVKTVPARGELTYSTVCPTLADSTVAEGMYWSVFFVSAMTADPLVYFDSQIDSGYSVDNLPPTAPKDLIVASSGDSVVSLFWKPNSEADLWYYAVYRDTISGFAPAPSNHLGNTTDTTYEDTIEDDRTYYYRVTALDVSGNESGPSNEAIYEGVNVMGLLVHTPKAFTLLQNYPNPFNPITQINYALPRNCNVKLSIYNILGQKVATLVDGQQQAGYKTTRWDASSLSSGIYFYRLQAGDFVQTRKIVLLR
jgi:hypothetical protein